MDLNNTKKDRREIIKLLLGDYRVRKIILELIETNRADSNIIKEIYSVKPEDDFFIKTLIDVIVCVFPEAKIINKGEPAKENQIKILKEEEEEIEDEEFDANSYFIKESRKGKFKNTVQILNIRDLYLKEANSKEELSDNETRNLFLRIEEIKKEDSFCNRKTISDIKNKIIESHLRFVIITIKRFLRSIKVGLNDTVFLNLVQAGNLGLMDTVDKFDVFKDYNFKTYAEYRVTGECAR